MALERNSDNLPKFIRGMSDSDSGIRYWSVVGLHLLEDKANPAVQTLENALNDNSDEVKIAIEDDGIGIPAEDVTVRRTHSHI